MPAQPLPGMPAAAADMFVCRNIGEAPQPRARTVAAVRERARAGPAWLVLTICEHCNHITGRYCREHNATNWWLTNWRR